MGTIVHPVPVVNPEIRFRWPEFRRKLIGFLVMKYQPWWGIPLEEFLRTKPSPADRPS